MEPAMDVANPLQTPVDAPLFERVLGPDAFAALPAPIRRLHGGPPAQCWRGRAQVERGTHPLVPLLAWTAGLPSTGDVPLAVRFRRDGARERWRRDFAGQVMASTLWQRGSLLCERLGPVTFGFALQVHAQGVDWQVRRVRLLGLPLPLRWFAGARGGESVQGTDYGFSIEVVLPWIGPLVRYHGWLRQADVDG